MLGDYSKTIKLNLIKIPWLIGNNLCDMTAEASVWTHNYFGSLIGLYKGMRNCHFAVGITSLILDNIISTSNIHSVNNKY